MMEFMYVYRHVLVYICMYYTHACMYVFWYVLMNACMYICM